MARNGFLQPERTPRGGLFFCFQDIILMRSAKELLGSGLTPRKVHAALAKLTKSLPTGRPLSGVKIRAEGGRVLVRDAGQSWQVDSGQLQLDFDVAEMATRLAPMARRVATIAHEEHALDSDEWYNLAIELEPVEPLEAERACQRAIDLDPNNSDAFINLGRLAQERGDTQAAIAHYQRAMEADPSNPIGQFNLGTAMEDAGRVDDAITAYHAAVNLDERFTDAHFNLARLHEQRGEMGRAIRHLRSDKRLPKTD
jgi:tetratricopeptide (TPR) repeat protein